MDKPVGLSCPLCLQADEPESMLTVHITHGLAVREFDVTLCSQCVAAIVARIEQAVATAGEEATDQGAAAAKPESGEGAEVAEDGSHAQP
jgi:hypothetical protein